MIYMPKTFTGRADIYYEKYSMSGLSNTNDIREKHSNFEEIN